MLKQIYRIIILLAVFIAALSYFSGDIKEVVFDIDNTTDMEEVTFPLVTIKTGDNVINQLHGYSSNLDANKIRESIIPLDLEQSFEVQIDQKDYSIKKLNYEVREFVGNALIETDSVSVFEEDGNLKTAKIKLQAKLEVNKEYAVKIILITSTSEKMYFYQRIKIYEDFRLKDKLDFIVEFHKAILDKNTAQDMIKYLEPSKDADNSSLAYVNINSSFELVSWGNLQPVILTEIIPAVKEIYADTASVELTYIAQAAVGEQTETYRVTEFYRVRYSPDRMFLLNYERHMESVFDINLASVSQSELKLGITEDYEVPYVAGEDKTKIAFVRNRELWFYDLSGNEITKVFSFRQENTDYIRDIYDQHDIRIVNMDAEGNIDFMVYGYMNRGQYEGRVAILLYRYIRAENRIEEQVYVPIDEPYQTLKENMGELSYINSQEIFYFQVYNNIYSYNMITRKLSETAKNVGRNQVMVFGDLSHVVWQENADPKLSESIKIMDMESGSVSTITAEQGYNIRLLDMIDSNIIYGFVKVGDIASMIDGSIIVPLSTIEIAGLDKTFLKGYHKEGFYISGIEVKDNIIELRRVRKTSDEDRNRYTQAEADHIINKEQVREEVIQVTARVTDQALTEYYMALPETFVMDEVPEVLTTVSTIIEQDPTIRLPEAGQNVLLFYPYVTGGIEAAYENAADAIIVARDKAGVVWNNENRIVWERGVRTSKNTISAIENMSIGSAGDSVVNCLKLVLSYQGTDVPVSRLDLTGSSAYDILKEYSMYPPVRLTGITLDDALYYVSKNRPVIAMTGQGNAVVIYGYDTFNIMVMNPATGKKERMGIQDSTALFESAGNVFLSYLGN